MEAAPARGGSVPGQDGLDYGALGKRLTGLDRVFAVRFEVVHVETQDVLVLDGVGDGVFVQGLLEQVFRSEEHTSELQSLMRISYAVFCLKKKNKNEEHKIK